MPRIITSLSLGILALTISACGPSAEELQEEREAEFRGTFIVSCIESSSNSGATPEVIGNVCDCAASKVVSDIGIPEDGSEPELPEGAVPTILNACIAEEMGAQAS